MYEHFLHWTEDGSHLVFSLDDQIWTFDIERSQPLLAADVDSDYWGPDRIESRRSASSRGERYVDVFRFNYGFYADVSPDGSRIVYSACEPVYDSFYQRNMDLYEIATVNMDGSGYLRLTENEYFENYPVWSPDGTEIALIRSESVYRHYEDDQRSARLYIKSAEDGEVRRLDSTERLALYPPVWSPDGQRLAFIANEGGCCPLKRALYTVRADDSDLTRIGETTAPPTWSPDGEELAFAAVEGEEAVIYAVRADGTGLRTLWRSGLYDPSTPVSQVSWSPDGSEILFTFDHLGLYVIGSDGSDLRPLGPRSGTIRAAWSPDGSKVAIYYVDYLLVTAARDGTDLRFLVGVTEKGYLYVLAPPLSERPVDLAACSAGRVVPEPEANPGLVNDCEVLLSIRDRLGGVVELNWNESAPMAEWEGVILRGSPSRVHRLILESHNETRLAGTVPSELGGLSELRMLVLSGNYLNGNIPPELGGLTKLSWLDLSDNYLSGSIPQELKNLTNLRFLYLSGNGFTGCIPIALRGIEYEDLGSLGLPDCEAFDVVFETVD